MPRKPPPADKRFKPGQSGNPKGRPKGAVSIKAAVKAALQEKNRLGRTAVDVIGDVVVMKAKRGDMSAIHFAADANNEPVKQRVVLEGATVQTLTSQVVSILRRHVAPDVLPKIVAELAALAAGATEEATTA